jgi:hypothetical protein
MALHGTPPFEGQLQLCGEKSGRCFVVIDCSEQRSFELRAGLFDARVKASQSAGSFDVPHHYIKAY